MFVKMCFIELAHQITKFPQFEIYPHFFLFLYDIKVNVPNMEEVNSLRFLGEDEIPEDLKPQRHRLPEDHKKAVQWLRDVALCSCHRCDASQCSVS